MHTVVRLMGEHRADVYPYPGKKKNLEEPFNILFGLHDGLRRARHDDADS